MQALATRPQPKPDMRREFLLLNSRIDALNTRHGIGYGRLFIVPLAIEPLMGMVGHSPNPKNMDGRIARTLRHIRHTLEVDPSYVRPGRPRANFHSATETARQRLFLLSNGQMCGLMPPDHNINKQSNSQIRGSAHG